MVLILISAKLLCSQLADQHQMLMKLIKRFWDIDSAGIYTQKTVVDADEKAALKKAENCFRFIDGRYEIGIPWKEEFHQMGNNHNMAMKRLQNTEKRLLKKPDLMKAYDEDCLTVSGVFLILPF